MKFVSVLLVAMIAMALVMPALACAGQAELCNDVACCAPNTCVGTSGSRGKHWRDNQNKFCYPPPDRSARSQVRKSLLSALSMLEDN